MNPSNQLRLATMIRAIQESIMPAIREDAPLAKEQAGLLMGHLAAMMQQDGQEHAVVAREWELLAELAGKLLDAAEGDSALTESAEKARTALAASDATALSFAVEAMLANTEAGASFKVASAKLAMTYAKAHTNLGRAWFMPMGFDGPSAALPSVSEQLG